MLPGIRRPFLLASAASALLNGCAASGLEQLSFEAGPEAPNGRRYPLVPNTPFALAQQLAQVEAALGASDPTQLGALAHRQQVLYRHWSKHLDWDRAVLALLPEELRARAQLQLQARREFLAMHRRTTPPAQLPAWRIVAPAPAEQLLAAYKQAEKDTGIDWATLAAINLVETGMGRLQGLSVVGARGPMQFLASTWAEPGIGKGSIDNPSDAIPAAARYLVRRGGRTNLAGAIWGYNNSWHYVRAVQSYANLMRTNPRQFEFFHGWQIHYATPAGDLWLPEGYERQQPVPVAQHLREAPWSAPPAR
jgi:membrane-bound lytic murein transglycosylase B